MVDGTNWVVMQSVQHAGCFVVPAPNAFEGWDETLPLRLGVADLDRGALVSDVNILDVTSWFYEQKGTRSAVDSDPALTAKFVGM